MKIVHSFSLYNEKENKDVIIDRVSITLNSLTTKEDIEDVLNTELNKDFMLKSTGIYLEYGIEVAKAYAHFKFNHGNLAKEEIELLQKHNLMA